MEISKGPKQILEGLSTEIQILQFRKSIDTPGKI